MPEVWRSHLGQQRQETSRAKLARAVVFVPRQGVRLGNLGRSTDGRPGRFCTRRRNSFLGGDMYDVETTKEDEALHAIRERLRENLDEGVTCPCCGQYAKRYKRKLNSSMAAALCWLWTHSGYAWCDVPSQAPSWVLKAREYPKLAWWGLLSLIHICRCRRLLTCSSRWSPYH